MYKEKFILIVFILLLINCSCSNSTNPEDISSIAISHVKNIQWNLVSVEISSNKVNVNNFEPFRIVLLSDKIWGTNNCNSLYGNYAVQNDKLIITGGGPTEVACPSRNLFPFEHLFGNPKIMKRGRELILLKNDTTYVYYSNYTMDISGQNFLNDTLALNNSNDNDITFFDSLGLYPKLILSSNREFNIQWYNKPPENTFMINHYSGIFGINENGWILFTKINGSYEGGVSLVNWNLVYRIIAANKFEYNNNILKLINTQTNTYYEFKK